MIIPLDPLTRTLGIPFAVDILLFVVGITCAFFPKVRSFVLSLIRAQIKALWRAKLRLVEFVFLWVLYTYLLPYMSTK